MENQIDVLNHFSEKSNPINKLAFKICAFLFAVNYLLSLITFFYSLKVAKIDIESLLSYKLVLVQLFFVRVLPIIALVLYIVRKKAGWILLLVYSVNDLLSKSEFVINFVFNNKIISTVDPFLSVPILIMFVLSFAISFLLLSKSISKFLGINLLVKLVSLLASILIYFIIKYYLVDLFISLMK